jgi:hypothetical protein
VAARAVAPRPNLTAGRSEFVYAPHDRLTGVNDADYRPPFPLTAKHNKLTIKVDRPELSPDHIKKLQEAQPNNKLSE